MQRFLGIFLWFLAVNVCFADSPRPNILWISCEDISPHLGCFGDEHAITPQLDELATDACRYTQAFTTAGVCAPCRSAIITGVYQTTLGTHHMRCNAQLPNFIKPFPTYLRQAGYFCTNNRKQDYQFKTPKNVWDESSAKAHWKNRKDPEQPFFAVFNFTGCHESGIAGEAKYRTVTKDLRADQRQDPNSLELPPYYPDTPIVREDWKRNYELITAMDAWAGDLIRELKAAGLYEDTIIFFWSDHGVGLPRAKRWLYDSGTHIPLIVRVPEKYRVNGQASPGTENRELVSSLDFAPTVLELAGCEIPEHMQGRAFLGADRGAPRDYVFGARDRMDERYDIIRSVRNHRYRYIRNYEPFKAYYQYMNTPEKGATMKELRRLDAVGQLPPAAALFMSASKPTEELYDLETDPHEIHNVADAPEMQDVLDQLRKVHLDWVAETRDLGLLPESELLVREGPAGSRYEILHRAPSALIPEIRRVANLACGGPDGIPSLVAAIDHSDAAVRYWSLIGLGNLADASSAQVDRVREKLADSAPCVRIAAARALIKYGETDSSLDILRSELCSDNDWARLRAAIVLDEAGEVAKPLIPEMRACLSGQPNKYITRVANRTINKLLGTDNVVP